MLEILIKEKKWFLFFICHIRANIKIASFFFFIKYVYLSMFGENKWSHCCRRPILSFNGTHRGRKKRKMISSIITFWLYSSWMILLDYLRLIYYTNWNLSYRSRPTFSFLLLLMTSNSFKLMSYIQTTIQNAIRDIERKQTEKQNDDEWINYPPTVITVGYPCYQR
jgi:hypothetical protein